MNINELKTAIVQAVNQSKFQVNFIENTKNGLLISVERPTKYSNKKVINGVITDEIGVRNFAEALAENLN